MMLEVDDMHPGGCWAMPHSSDQTSWACQAARVSICLATSSQRTLVSLSIVKVDWSRQHLISVPGQAYPWWHRETPCSQKCRFLWGMVLPWHHAMRLYDTISHATALNKSASCYCEEGWYTICPTQSCECKMPLHTLLNDRSCDHRIMCVLWPYNFVW